MLESENDAQSGYNRLACHLDSTGKVPRALIAGNNPLLLGSMKLAAERRIAIPQEMAVVAYDEFAWSELTDPPMTVLNEHSEQIGRLAAMTLSRIIDKQVEAEKRGQAPTPVCLPEDQQRVPARLIIRCSCGCSRDSAHAQSPMTSHAA